MFPNASEGTEQVYEWFAKSQVDYSDYFIKRYIAYNAWYRIVAKTNNDREALGVLKKRFVIWCDYVDGYTMQALRPLMTNIATALQAYPLPAHFYWNGTIQGDEDWRGLIEYWYQVRCLLVHGAAIPAIHAQLAYESLGQFMEEIVQRMRRCFTVSDLERLEETSILALSPPKSKSSESFKRLQQKLQMKYITSPDVWQVDMQQVPQT